MKLFSSHPSGPSRHWLARAASLSLFAAATLAVACEQEERAPGTAPNMPNQPRPTCVDEDGDGYGIGCLRGLDCNDADPNVTVECLCGKPNPGCACDDEGAVRSCGTVYDKIGSQVTCGQGLMTCSGGVWGECIINGAISLATQQPKKLTPGVQLLALGAGQSCATNPCDPSCTTFPEDPADLELDPDTGVVASPDGVTLSPSSGVPGPPVGGGFGCKGGTYPSITGACAHHICETGEALDPTCDEKPAISETLVLFEDTFSGGNAKGWTLDSTWAIGAAKSSSGHTTGGPDPSTDTTSTADNRIAGTVLGGNIGGWVTIFTDTFSNLNQWNESGGANWNTESLNGSSGYPANASGSPAAHSDGCSAASGCTITLKNGINLSSYSTVRLELLRYLSTSLESGDYLRLDVAPNGSTWTTLAEWKGGTHDDSKWHAQSFDLSSYRGSNFKLRFVTKQDKTDEHVHVDDVKILVSPTAETRWLTSPAFDGTAANGSLTLTFRRWLNIEAPTTRTALVDVFNGTTWVNVWKNNAAVKDTSWTTQTLDITAHKHSAMRIRFGWTGAGTSVVSGWNLDDIAVRGQHEIPAIPGCVARVCEEDPSCCADTWHAGCLAMIASECQIDCARNTETNECLACYNDPTETTDYDGDGQSPAEGDCLECDARVNTRALDFPDNGVDDDCDGTVDNTPTSCDGALSPGGDAWSHVKAIGLCKVAMSPNDWGVTSAAFVRADGTTACTDSKQYYIVNNFGSGNQPTEGSQMVAYSSGTARRPGDSGYVKPNGEGYDAKTSSTPAYSVPAAEGCSAGVAGYDSCGLKITLRAPSNAQSFSYNFNFFTSEFPEWLCTKYNDAFVAYYYGSLNPAADKNISFDKQGNPVSVNNGFFEIPGLPPPSSGSHPLLNGSGFDGVCSNKYEDVTYSKDSICGGATGWLVTSAPIKPNEEVTLHFSIWDTGDHAWDSTVLIDNFKWSPIASSVETGRYDPGGEPWIPFVEADFVRDYDMSTTCEPGQSPVWSLWSWSATTPEDSRIEFYVRTANTAAELDSAPEDALIFSQPAAKAGQPAIAAAQPLPDTQVGSAFVYRALEANGRPTHLNFVRIRAHLVPTSDQTAAPTLRSWNLQASCMDNE